MKVATLFFFFIPCFCTGQQNPGPRTTALGLVGAVGKDVWSMQSNQAGLTVLGRPVLAAAYERKYANPDLSTSSVVFAYPFKRNFFAISYQNYGFSAYKEQKFSYAYARKFGPGLSAGVDFNVHQIGIEQYGRASAVSVEAGLQYRVSEKLEVGIHAANPTQNAYDHQVNASIPVLAEIGAAYAVSDKVALSSAFCGRLRAGFDSRFGLEYQLSRALALRGGVTAKPFRQCFGFGIQTGSIHFDFATSSHPSLGFSPQLGLSYEL